jgi:3-methylfumaryl-CoA hydratase
MSIDIDHLKRWIGREQWASEVLSPFPARALAAMLDHARLPEGGEPLPPAWHWLYFLQTPSAAETGDDGHPLKGGFLPLVPLPRRMWAAGSFDLIRPLRLGLPAEKISMIRSVELKRGSTGTLVFVKLEHELRQEGSLCLREEQDLVYREMPVTAVPLPPGDPSPAVPERLRRIEVNPVLLFRFSALTYNAHRIHYDREYATRTEFYPGLVVHAPLLAILVLDLAVQMKPGIPITQFRFRAVRPTIDVGPIHLGGKCEGSEMTLWSSDHENFVGLRATALLGDPS